MPHSPSAHMVAEEASEENLPVGGLFAFGGEFSRKW